MSALTEAGEMGMARGRAYPPKRAPTGETGDV